MDEAIHALEELFEKVKAEEYVNHLAKRFIMSGIRMSIQCLHYERIEKSKEGKRK